MPSSERACMIQIICEELFTQRDFTKILGQTKDMTISEIRGIYDASKSWNVNPPALFWKLLKEKNKEIKKTIKIKIKNGCEK